MAWRGVVWGYTRSSSTPKPWCATSKYSFASQAKPLCTRIHRLKAAVFISLSHLAIPPAPHAVERDGEDIYKREMLWNGRHWSFSDITASRSTCHCPRVTGRRRRPRNVGQKRLAWLFFRAHGGLCFCRKIRRSFVVMMARTCRCYEFARSSR